MADGYTRIKRGKRNGVFAAQAGPGIENAFPGIAQAYSENVPLLVIPAGLPLARQYVRPMFRAADVYRPVTKWSALAHAVAGTAGPDAPRLSRHAQRQGRAGPDRNSGRGVRRPNIKRRARLHAGAGAALGARSRRGQGGRQMLLAAKSPLLWAGQGVHYAEASDRLAALAELIPAPVVTTNPGKSAIPESHPLALGASTRSRPKMFTDFMAKADLVLAIGSSLTRTPFGPGVPPGKTIIHSTNDAGDINKEYRVAHAVIGDAALVLDALIAEVGAAEGRRRRQCAHLAQGGGRRGQEGVARRNGRKQLDSDETPINQYRVIRDLMRTVDRDNVIMTHDSGSPREQLLPFWETTAAGSYMGWGKSTQLGYGLGIIMGAKLAAPKKLCVNVMGDAAIGMTGMDIETAARNRIAHPHGGVQQRRHGAPSATCSKISDREVRRADRRRQLRQGGRGTQRRRDAGSRSRPTSCRRSRRPSRSRNRARRSCSRSWSRKATTSRAIRSRGCNSQTRSTIRSCQFEVLRRSRSDRDGAWSAGLRKVCLDGPL